MCTKIIAMYLPQYHNIPENDEWWGRGYTDWKAVKESKPSYEGHIQPRTPLNNNYYDLSRKECIVEQVNIANKYGIYGFGIYHYWFSSKQVLLDTPPKLIKDNKDIKINYFFIWDNGSWKRTWSNVKFSNSWAPLYEHDNSGPEILAELIYGDEKEWRKHFEYLLPYFKDDRYIKIDKKPLFGIFNQDNNSNLLRDMSEYWDELAKNNGLQGIKILGKSNSSNINITDYQFDYEPATHAWNGKNNLTKALLRLKDSVRLNLGYLKKYDYDTIWNRIIDDVNSDDNYFVGAFVRYDDTPRRGRESYIVTGETPEKFKKYMKKLIQKAEKKNKKIILLTAWNEWGEGAYLEPDENNGYAYLEALKAALDECCTK